jgi:hypothetical protein
MIELLVYPIHFNICSTKRLFYFWVLIVNPNVAIGKTNDKGIVNEIGFEIMPKGFPKWLTKLASRCHRLGGVFKG